MTTVGKVEASKATSAGAVTKAKVEDQPNSIHNTENKTVKEKTQPKKDKFGFTIVEEPKLNNVKVKAGTDGARGSVDALAEQYKSTRAAIAKANNLQDINKLKEGQELIIPSKTGKAWDMYKAYQEKYHNAVYEAERKLDEQEQAKIVENNKVVANGKIAEAKEKGLDEKYEFSTDEKGNVVIILKSEIEVDDIVDDFKLKEEILRKANGNVFETVIKQENYWNGRKRPYNDSKAKAGLKLTIPSNEIGAGRTFWDKLWGN